MDNVQHDHRSATGELRNLVILTQTYPINRPFRPTVDRGDVPRLLHFQRPPVHIVGAPRGLDLLHTQDLLQGHVHGKGERDL